jgi:hypothetical protein
LTEEKKKEIESERREGWGEEGRESGGRRPQEGMKSPWETPPGFWHQNVKEGLKTRTETSRSQIALY